jgi:hypothetical protein
MSALGAACLTLLFAVPTFLLTYKLYGGARKRTQFSVMADEKESLELCLASLGELDDSFVTEVDEKQGKVTALCNMDNLELQVQFKIVPLASGCSHIYASCQPVDQWRTIDFKRRSRTSLNKLREFMLTLTEWNYEHDSNVTRHHICHRPQNASGRGWLSSTAIVCFALSAVLLFLTVKLWQGRAATSPTISPVVSKAHARLQSEAEQRPHASRALLVSPGESMVDIPPAKHEVINSLDHRIYMQYHSLTSTLRDKGAIYAGLGKATRARQQYEKARELKSVLYETTD